MPDTTTPAATTETLRGVDLEGMCEAFHRVIEAHADKHSPFHQPVNADAMTALRTLRGIVSALATQVGKERIIAKLSRKLGNAEWRDKHIYVCEGPTLQHWKIELYLPVPLDASDKSPEAALQRWLNES